MKLKTGEVYTCRTEGEDILTYGPTVQVILRSMDHSGMTTRYYVEGTAKGLEFKSWVQASYLSAPE